MAGGVWTSQNKVRPGVYINFRSVGEAPAVIGERGTVIMALPLSWGPSKEIMTIEAAETATLESVLGYDITAEPVRLIREALKRARTLLLYRLNTGTAATATSGALTATAKYSGVRGNDITITVQESLDNEDQFEVRTMVGGVEKDKQIAATIAELKPNNWVKWTGTGALTATAGVPLTGGGDGTVTNAEHADFQVAAELQAWNTMAYVGTDITLKSVYAAYIKRLRDNEGFKSQLVLENYRQADYEGVISVKNGVILEDGTTITAAQATAWVAGATAGAAVNESLTYQAYDGAVDVATRYTGAQIVAALQAGEFLFTAKSGRAIVEQDINTFTSFEAEKDRVFSKNRPIRTLDGFANDVSRIGEERYIGKVDNNDSGRSLLWKDVVKQAAAYQEIGAFQNFASEDFKVFAGEEIESVYTEGYVQTTDSTEKMYFLIRNR